MKLNYKNIRLFVILSGLILAFYIAFDIVKSIFLWSSTMNTFIGTVNSVPIEYLNLFRDSDFTNKFTELNTVRYPVSHFDYDNNKYRIVVTKINMVDNLLINSIVNETNTTEKNELEGGHLMISQLKSNFEYLPRLQKVANIFLCLSGDSIKSITRNDTVISYYFKMKSFSVKYNIGGPDDLLGIAKSNYTPSSVLAFVFHNKSLYFIFISDNYDDILPPDILNKLMLGHE